jgi:hypothetical protein
MQVDAEKEICMKLGWIGEFFSFLRTANASGDHGKETQ